LSILFISILGNFHKIGIYWLRTLGYFLFVFLFPIGFLSGIPDATSQTTITSYLKVPLLLGAPDLDPSKTWEFENSYIISAVYDSLFMYGEEGEVEPNIAQSLPLINDDGKTYKIVLRNDARFHDDPCFKDGKGRAVTARDVIFTIKRIADPANKSGLWSLIAGRIDGLDQFRKGLVTGRSNFSDPVKGLIALSEGELEIQLVDRFSQLVCILGMIEFGIVPEEAFEKYGSDFSRHPVGTGPFQFQAYNDRKLLLKARPSHWRFKSTFKEDIPAGIVFTYYDDSFNAFRSGNLDTILIPPNRLHSYLDENYQLKNDLSQKGYSVRKVESPSNYYLLFNYQNRFLQDIHVRQAIRSAVPWYLIAGETDLHHGSFIPLGVKGYIDLKYEWNPEKAKDALKRAGYPNGTGLPEFIIRFTDNGIMLRHAAMVEDALEAVGIPARIDFGEAVLEGADIGFYGWLMDYPDAQNFFILLDSKASPPNGENYGFFKNPDYDMLLEKAGYSEGEEKINIYRRIDQLIYDEAAAIPFRQATEFWAIHPRIAKMECRFGFIDWTSLRMDSNHRFK
jgi:ABC-type transport system substrate-binding protein